MISPWILTGTQAVMKGNAFVTADGGRVLLHEFETLSVVTDLPVHDGPRMLEEMVLVP